MAFGTWLKKAFGKAKDFVVNKALPAVKKVAGFVGKAAEPVLGAVGSVIGGPLGSTIAGVGSKLSGFSRSMNSGATSIENQLKNNSLGLRFKGS